ncbi:hypothetical protein A9Q84_09700 [Halobacteriovorax marinus]|uniref:Radical SAM core domain-containing protein n=1 Tax=Halobacteriovorax marinus TaxID=97084 RepID=A0A1Y5F935_9BACT|nr:hypothetical protein A9Q84_09700 [Halobacteriovorax marinus]
MEYEEPVFRPPSEGRSFLLQVTIGCSHNLCTYCNMYRSKKYRERSFEEIKAELLRTQQYFQRLNYTPSKVFLCDGDALGASTELLVQCLDLINELFPSVMRVGIYATAENMLQKSEEDLMLLASKKLTIAYLGMESGADSVLHMIVKGNTASDMIRGTSRLRKCGIKLSVIAMLGVGGREKSEEHVRETAKLISDISPEFFSFLTTVAVKGTPFKTMVDRGRIDMLTTKELTTEMRDVLKNITPSQGRIIFRANHVSNQYPLGGILPNDQASLIETLNEWIEATPAGVYPETPEHML